MAITPSEKDQKRFDGDVPELLNTELQPNARSNKKIMDETVVGNRAVSGARSVGKDASECATVRLGSKPASETVRTVDLSANKDTRQKACDQQSGRGDGNPKKRTKASWGIKTSSQEE